MGLLYTMDLKTKSLDEIERFCFSSRGKWYYDGNDMIVHYSFPSFTGAVKFVQDVAEVSESLKHHPKITIDFNTVHIQVHTHDVEGITQKDFDLAQEIDTLIKK